MIITIDGPSGTGKSTVAKKVAEKLGATFFDTGAMYRAVTWALLKENIPFTDIHRVEKLLENFSFDIRHHDGKTFYIAQGIDVTEEIRTQKINKAVSEVSAIGVVRETMWKLQRGYAEKQTSVFEGRDMGSVVFPDADLKIFLDASPNVRAKRRLKEMREKLPHDAKEFDEEKMAEDLKRRDIYDSTRKLAPLKCPKDAIKIDTSGLSIDEVVEKILRQFHKKVKKLEPSWLRSKKMKLLYRMVLFFSWLLFKSCYRHKTYGLEHFTKRAAIIAPNHTSYFDPPIASFSWPEEVHFLAREGLFRNLLFGKFIRALNSHPVHGGVADVSVFKTILELLEEGKQVVLFPEGGRSAGLLEEIKPGIGMLLMRSKSAIIPTYIHGAYEIWSRERKFPKLIGKTACVFGSPIFWESFAHLPKKEAQIAIAKELSDSIKALQKWYESGAEGIPP